MPTPRQRLVLGLAGLAVAALAHAAEAADARHARSLAATCAACHGTDGRPPAGATMPGLAGLPAAYLVEQMRDFRRGARPSTVMQQLARGFSDAQIESLGAFFALQPK
ncbi:MAG TPA: c-type cytochrome [Ideonella sp.]|nr:c-type cytochrome [Ideonella sp.]